MSLFMDFCFDGALNVSSYRENVRHGLLPSVDAITFEGLFSQYFFKTGCDETEERVHATFSVAQCPSPITGEVDRYVSIGLNSSEDGKNRRDPLNLVLVLDISGSMGSAFLRRADSRDADDSGTTAPQRTKMDIAKEVLIELIQVMTDKERMGIVLFDTVTEILQPFRDVSLIDREELTTRVREDVHHRGGTNMEIALQAAIEMLTDHQSSQGDAPTGATNSRIIFLTDAQPNSGAGGDGLVGLINGASDKGIYTTLIGIGLDFNSTLTEQLTKVRGSNYFAVHSRREFQRILNEDFNYIVTELAHDTTITMDSSKFGIGAVYGTPYPVVGNVIQVGTMGASAVDPRGLKGGILLVKLAEVDSTEASEVVSMTLKYTFPGGMEEEVVCQIDFGTRVAAMVEEGRIFEHDGVRKAVLLAQYGSIIRGMLQNAHESHLEWLPEDDIERLKQFKKYYEAEAAVLKDQELIQELDALDRLIYRKTS